MVKVVNPTGNPIKDFFYGHGEIVVGPEEVKEVPKAVWEAWQNPNLWGGGDCRLKLYEPPKEPRVFQCKKCGEEFDTPQKLGNHMKTEHKRPEQPSGAEGQPPDAPEQPQNAKEE